MALTYGFYNSYAGDRKYDAMQISEMFDGILADGIIPSQGQLFAVTAGGGMTINVGTGRAWFFHSWTKNDSVMMLTVPASDVSRPRIDAVVLEVNRDQEVRANSIKIVSGEAAVNPVKPTLVTTDKVHQYPLAYITVGAGVEEIKAENIENAVGLTPTPFATGVLETTPLDELWSQWEGEWDTWFANIKLQLSGDIVANLQGQIDELREEVEIRIRLVAESKALVKLALTYPNGRPASGIRLTSPKTYEGENIILGEDGTADVYVTGGADPTLFSIDYVDMTWSKSVVCLAGNITEIKDTIAIKASAMITSTKDIAFSPNVEKITYIIGAGGTGGSSKDAGSGLTGSGGSGGTVSLEIEAIPDPYVKYTVNIGAGGNGGAAIDYYRTNATAYPGSSGGSSSFMETSVSSGGGGKGGAGISKYSSSSNKGAPASTSSIYGGGGGCGGVSETREGYPLTTPIYGAVGGPSGGSGGNGGYVSNGSPTGYPGSSGSYSGGGGGGGLSEYILSSGIYYSNGAGGKGGNGFLKITMELKDGAV